MYSFGIYLHRLTPFRIKIRRDGLENASPTMHVDPIRPKQRFSRIQSQIEREIQKQKEKDHHWEDQIDVRILFDGHRSALTLYFRLLINSSLFRTIIACSSTFSRQALHRRPRHHVRSVPMLTIIPFDRLGLCVFGMDVVVVSLSTVVTLHTNILNFPSYSRPCRPVINLRALTQTKSRNGELQTDGSTI
jgi:hypothetical protein